MHLPAGYLTGCELVDVSQRHGGASIRLWRPGCHQGSIVESHDGRSRALRPICHPDSTTLMRGSGPRLELDCREKSFVACDTTYTSMHDAISSGNRGSVARSTPCPARAARSPYVPIARTVGPMFRSEVQGTDPGLGLQYCDSQWLQAMCMRSVGQKWIGSPDT